MTFKEGHRTVFICKEVLDGLPVLYVSHDTDGDWHLLCGKNHSGTDEKAYVAGINHLVRKDPTLADIESLPQGFFAERKDIGKMWNKTER